LTAEMAQSQHGHIVDVVDGHGKGLSRILSEDGPRDIVLIMTGTNDLAQNHSPETLMGNIRRLHATCHAHGAVSVAVGVPPAPCRNGPQEAVRLRLNALLADWAGRAHGVGAYVDPGDFVRSTPGSGHFDIDGLHFSPAGSRTLGQCLAKRVAPCLPNASTPPSSVVPSLQPTSMHQAGIVGGQHSTPRRRQLTPPQPMRTPQDTPRSVLGSYTPAMNGPLVAVVQSRPIPFAQMRSGIARERAGAVFPLVAGRVAVCA
jgi:hypothetical protein